MCENRSALFELCEISEKLAHAIFASVATREKRTTMDTTKRKNEHENENENKRHCLHIKEEGEDADLMHFNMMAKLAQSVKKMLALVAPHIDRMERFMNSALPHEFHHLGELMGEVLSAVPAAPGAFDFDTRAAAVAECLRRVRPEVPQHAASVLLAVLDAWPDVNWQTVYMACTDASTSGFWAPVDLSATHRLPLSDLFVLAAAVSAHLSMRYPESIVERQQMLPPDGAVVTSERVNPCHFMFDSVPAYLAPADDAAAVLCSPELAHIWEVIRRAGDARVIAAFTRMFGGPGDDDDDDVDATRLLQAMRSSFAAVSAPDFLRSVSVPYSRMWRRGGRYTVLYEGLRDVLPWTDIAKLAVLLHKGCPRCPLSFMPLMRACERGVAPALLPTLLACEREDFEANAATEAAAVRNRIRMPGKGVDEVDPRLYCAWAESTFDAGELFADTQLRKAAAVRRIASAMVIDADNFPSFELYAFKLHGEDHIVPHVVRGTLRNADFFHQLLDFHCQHRPGTIREDEVRNVKSWLNNQ